MLYSIAAVVAIIALAPLFFENSIALGAFTLPPAIKALKSNWKPIKQIALVVFGAAIIVVCFSVYISSNNTTKEVAKLNAETETNADSARAKLQAENLEIFIRDNSIRNYNKDYNLLKSFEKDFNQALINVRKSAEQ